MLNKNELLNVLYKSDCDELLSLSREKLLELFGEPVAIQKDYDQNNPHHCYTLLEHTLRAVDYIKQLDIKKQDKDILLVAALYHDCGKPMARFDKPNKSVYHSHPLYSKKLAAPLLNQLEFSEEELKKLLFIIEYHDIFIPYKLEDDCYNEDGIPITQQNVKKCVDSLIAKSNASLDDIKLLIPIGCADASSQNPVATSNGKIVDTSAQKIKRVEAFSYYLNTL